MLGRLACNAVGRAKAANGLWCMIGGDLIGGAPGMAIGWYWQARKAVKVVESVVEGRIPEMIGALVCSRVVHSPVIRVGVGLIRRGMGSRRPGSANKLDAGRSWALSKEAPRFDRMVIIYHDADKAGRHIDIHIGKLSIVKRLPKDFAVSTDADGRLTEATKARVMSLVAAEFKGRAWLAQNLDHDSGDARCTWLGRDNGPIGYGAGESRQLVSDEPIYLSPGEHSLHVSAPHLINNRTVTIFKIMEKGPDRSVPILALGVQEPSPGLLPDRLHLKLDKNLDAFLRHVEGGTITVKYDGASCYVVRDEQGTRVYSPRVSKADGKRIEYTGKLPGIEKWKGPAGVGMGELLFYDGKGVMKAHEIGGMLNGGKLREDVRWKIKLYSGSEKLCCDSSTKSQKVNLFSGVEMPEIIDPCIVEKMKHVEGFVGVPAGGTLEDGRKFKWKADEHDWKVTEVGLRKGVNGGVAGVVKLVNSDGKEYRLGPSAGWSRSEAEDMMARPGEYVGRVAKVAGYAGHEGRAASFIAWHMDKGTG